MTKIGNITTNRIFLGHRSPNYGIILTLSVIILLAAIPTLSAADDIQLKAHVDYNKVGLNNRFKYTIDVIGEDLSGVGNPTLPPALDKFEILGRSTSSSTNISMIGSKLSKSVTQSYIYTLRAKEVGEYTIEPASVVYDNNKIYSNSVKLEVIQGSNKAIKKRGLPSDRQGASGITDELDEKDVRENIFLASTISRNKLYVGEQLTIEYSLYTRLPLEDLALKKEPSYTGFWSEELYNTKKLNFKAQNIDGKAYNAALLKKIALFPLSAGEQEIDPMSLECVVRTSQTSFFNFFGKLQKLIIDSKTKAITVLPLPDRGKPRSFSGAVGNYAISVRTDRTDLKSNEAFTLIFEITGAGNIFSLAVPEIQFPPDFETYDVKSNQVLNTSAQKLSGKKTCEYTLLPRSAGTYTIDPIEFSYFDPIDEKYVIKRTKPITLNVEQGKDSEGTGLRVVSKDEVVDIGADICYIKPNMDKTNGLSIATKPANFMLYWLMTELLLIIIAFAYKKRQEKFRDDIGFARNVKAYRKAKKNLQKLPNYKKDPEKYYSRLNEILLTYIGDKVNLPPAGLIIADVAYKLEEQGLGHDLIDTIRDENDFLNFAGFSPMNVNKKPTESKKELLDLIKEVEKKFK